MKHLLDVSVLLAAIWTAHSRHAEVFSWLADKSIVLCPLSELGFLRISTNRRAVGASMERARELLDRFAAERKADTIPDDLAPLDSHPRTSEEVTDLYLAELAAKHGLKLATLDRGITHSSAELVTLPVPKDPSS